MPKVNTPESFWARVDKRGPDECWPWLGPVTPKGYGKTYWGNKDRRAHQLAFMLSNGYQPPATLHTCDNPPCCNPKHLFAGTNGVNNTDRMLKGRNGDVRNEKHYACKLKNDDVLEIRRLCIRNSQADVADMFGISRSYVSQLSSGVRGKNLDD